MAQERTNHAPCNCRRSPATAAGLAEDKLRRAANLRLDPDLNDGVVLIIAPLRERVPWKEAKSYWGDLMDGMYEWSSIGKQLREKGLVGCGNPSRCMASVPFAT